MKKNADLPSNPALPTQPTTYLEAPALERLKNVQNLVKRNWTGIKTDHSGRPGSVIY